MPILIVSGVAAFWAAAMPTPMAAMAITKEDGAKRMVFPLIALLGR
jgi:hypothetical protein